MHVLEREGIQEQDVLMIKTSIEVAALVADYQRFVDKSAPTVMAIIKENQESGNAGSIIYARYAEIIRRMSGTVAAAREFFDFERIKPLERLVGARSAADDNMLVPPTGQFGAHHYWPQSAKGSLRFSEYLCVGHGRRGNGHGDASRRDSHASAASPSSL